MKRILPQGIMLLVAVLLTACATTQDPSHQITDYRTDVDFSRYQTFATQSVCECDNETEDRTHERVDRALKRALEAKGLRPASRESADLSVRYTVRLKMSTEVTENRPWNKDLPIQYGLDRFLRGSILINMVDTQSGQVIWKGIRWRRLQRSDVENLTQAQIDHAIGELLETFPPGQ